MDAAEQQRILQVLAEAQGNPALLALAGVDLTYPDLSSTERERLRHALLAAAIPHWFDAPFLAALLEATAEESLVLMERLRRLSSVESFRARGSLAYNVHEASRLPLREHVRTTQPELWQAFSRRARAYIATGDEPHLRIEALYHQFAADPSTSASACAALDRELSSNPAQRSALCLALTELTTAGWLRDAALGEALRVSQAHADSLDELGELALKKGDSAAAQQRFSESRTFRERLVVSDQADARKAGALAISMDNLGDISMTQGNLAEALRFFGDSKRIRERLVATDPANTLWQQHLSVSFDKLGDVTMGQGDLAGAKRAYTGSKGIAERLVASDPENTLWQRDLSVSLNKLGDVAAGQGDLAGAMLAYTESKGITERLAASDPADTLWQWDLSVSFERLGDVAVGQGGLTRAMLAYMESKAIRERLAASDPANALWQRDLTVSLDKLGNVAVGQGDLARAMRAYTESKGIAERLAASDPANTLWQRDLIGSYWRLARLCEKNKQTTEAKAWWRKAHDALVAMKQRGIMPPADEQYLKRLQTKVETD